MEAVLEITTSPKVSKRFLERYVIEVDPETGIVRTLPKPLSWQDVIHESKLIRWWDGLGMNNRANP